MPNEWLPCGDNSRALLREDVTRTQSRLKALYRSRGVSTPGAKVYSAGGREGYLAELPPSCRDAPELLYAKPDALRELKTGGTCWSASRTTIRSPGGSRGHDFTGVQIV